MKLKRSTSITAPLVVLVVLVTFLELIIRIAKIPETVLPTPTNILVTLITNFRGDLWPHLLWTLKSIGIGLIIGIPVGLLLAAFLSQFDLILTATTPIILVLVTTPLITIVPLFLLWVGFNPNYRFIIVVIQVVPIVCLNTLTGFKKTPNRYIELAKGYGASKMQTFIKIIFPNALPQVFMGIKIGCILSLLAAISMEFVGGKVGLGYRVVYFSGMLETSLVYAVIILIALLGVTLFTIVDVIQKRIITWVV